MTDYLKLIEKCETDLREGRGHLVASLLSELHVGDIPRAQRLPLANICRRTNQLALGLKIMNALTGPERVSDPTPAELAEYAVLLERSGAVNEALRILAEVDSRQVPEAPLYRAFAHFKSWDYAAAIPELNTYIAGQSSPYWKLVGQVNLAAAYVSERDFERALSQIAGNIELAEKHSFQRLKGNCFEIRAQVHLQLRDFKRMREDLNEAARIFAFEDTFDQFFVHKWQTVLKAFEDSETMGLVALRSQAIGRQDFETAREADLFRLQIRFDQSLLHHLYFGSPYASYRRRIEAVLGRKPEVNEYIYGETGGILFDVAKGVVAGAELKRGKLIHRTISALLRDLYRPLRVGGLFAEVFPDERFDIFTSPGRVHHMQFRVRQWLSENKIPAAMVEKNGLFSIKPGSGFGFQLQLEDTPVSGWNAEWNRLSSLITQNQTFSAADVRSSISLKPSSAKRFLNWAIESGHLVREGQNNSSVYRKAA
jgi:tetratricopeptide (TPR) repeat protein